MPFSSSFPLSPLKGQEGRKGDRFGAACSARLIQLGGREGRGSPSTMSTARVGYWLKSCEERRVKCLLAPASLFAT